jgi:hypothetical protein
VRYNLVNKCGHLLFTYRAWELECFRINLFVEPHPQKPPQRKYKDPRALEEDLPRVEAAKKQYESDMIRYNEMVQSFHPVLIQQKHDYIVTRKAKKFSPDECNKFRERYLESCKIRQTGNCWCHYCGPFLVTTVPKNTREIVLQMSRLHPINKEENHLICQNCFKNKFSSARVAPQAVELSKKINNQVKVFFQLERFLFVKEI